MLIAELVAKAQAQQNWKSEADVARALGVEPVRLYQWKTHRRRMPDAMLTSLAILPGCDLVAAAGAYSQEWQTVRNHPELIGCR